MHSLEHIAGELRKRKQKLTPQRRLIIEILSSDRSHPTADDVYSRVVAVMPEVSRTTVYNTLRELVAMGEIREVQGLSESGVRYDTYGAEHQHFFCVQCGVLEDIPCSSSSACCGQEGMEGFTVLRTETTMYGYCPQCGEANARER
ncbi:MAG TPA: transcriptional repressor [Synergistaceae bacterium]|jgi:Fe2+ or Zn2+ uptake regulation protein|nr:transcriptional repressor [Synergistaceae bacterium]